MSRHSCPCHGWTADSRSSRLPPHSAQLSAPLLPLPGRQYTARNALLTLSPSCSLYFRRTKLQSWPLKSSSVQSSQWKELLTLGTSAVCYIAFTALIESKIVNEKREATGRREEMNWALVHAPGVVFIHKVNRHSTPYSLYLSFVSHFFIFASLFCSWYHFHLLQNFLCSDVDKLAFTYSEQSGERERGRRRRVDAEMPASPSLTILLSYLSICRFHSNIIWSVCVVCLILIEVSESNCLGHVQAGAICRGGSWLHRCWYSLSRYNQ